jgi:hypothetical protein
MNTAGNSKSRLIRVTPFSKTASAVALFYGTLFQQETTCCMGKDALRQTREIRRLPTFLNDPNTISITRWCGISSHTAVI